LGGSPTNVAVAAARLGHSAAVLTGVGDDSFGRFVRREMVRLGVTDEFVITTADFATPVTFVRFFRRTIFRCISTVSPVLLTCSFGSWDQQAVR